MDDDTIAELARKKIWYVPTIDHNQYYIENADNVYKFPVGAKENLSNYILRNFETAKKAYRAGVRMLMGSDTVYNGFGLNMREITWFVKLGMRNEQALQAATVLPAEMLGLERSLGSIAAGYFADIVAVEGDPLANIEGGVVVVDKTRASREK